MGQRSQIYIRFNDNRMESRKGLIALYYQWNYGERMVSRARQIIEGSLDLLKYGTKFKLSALRIGLFKKQLKVACTANFDMRTIDIIPSDIFEECWENDDKPRDVLFNQDNNDGCLLIDILSNDKDEAYIKYALTDYNFSKALTPEEYMKWDDVDMNNKDFHDEKDKICYQENCEFIKTNATLMTKEEIDEFVGMDYSIKNAFDYENLEFQYECVKDCIEKYSKNSSKPIASVSDFDKVIEEGKLFHSPINQTVLSKIRWELHKKYDLNNKKRG